MVATEGGDLQAAREDRAEAVLVGAAGEDGEDALRPCIGGHVPITDGDAEQGITDTAADEVGAVAGLPQRVQHGHDLGLDREGRPLGARVRAHRLRWPVNG